MTGNLVRLAEQRERSVSQAAAQRMALAQGIEPWRVPLARVDLGLSVLCFVKRHPAWLAGGGILFAMLRPGRVGKWLLRGWLTWQIVQGLRSR